MNMLYIYMLGKDFLLSHVQRSFLAHSATRFVSLGVERQGCAEVKNGGAILLLHTSLLHSAYLIKHRRNLPHLEKI
jgi:hypothetical protein